MGINEEMNDKGNMDDFDHGYKKSNYITRKKREEKHKIKKKNREKKRRKSPEEVYGQNDYFRK